MDASSQFHFALEEIASGTHGIEAEWAPERKGD
jgi:hypothetical protein